MKDTYSGRPPPDAFHTVRDPDQARLLSDPESFRYIKPFIARDRTVSEAAAEVGCKLDTMLYRVRKFSEAGLLEVARLEKRAGRPIKHYRSSAEAYFIPFEVTPFADAEERLREQLQTQQDAVVRSLARVLRQSGNEGRRVYRRRDTGEVWSESAGDTQTFVDFYDLGSLRVHIEQARGPVSENLYDDEIALTDEEARSLLLELYRVWAQYRDRAPDGKGRRKYIIQFTLLPLEPK